MVDALWNEYIILHWLILEGRQELCNYKTKVYW
jgi:hypothetical protein